MDDALMLQYTGRRPSYVEGEVRGHPEVVHAGALDDAEDERWMHGVFTPLKY